MKKKATHSILTLTFILLVFLFAPNYVLAKIEILRPPEGGPQIDYLPMEGQTLKGPPPKPTSESFFNWNGIWKDDSNGIITIREQNSFLDITGKDAASIYKCVCLIDSKNTNEAICVGEGMNHQANFRFLYKSTISINVKNQLNETWEALYTGGKITGNTIFSKQK